LSVDDAPKIAVAISQLANVGLKPLFPERESPERARWKVDELEGIYIPDPPLPLTWLHLALTGSEQLFANAIHHQDHCFDGAGEEDYAEVVASIMALAGEEWPTATVSATSVAREGQYGPSERMEITILGQGGCAPFELIVHKDFDWSVITRLNERLPVGATGRFAAFFDGDAIIVYLRPDQFEELGTLFGYDFMSEIEPLEDQRNDLWEGELASPTYRRRSVEPPIWALVICLLMGAFAGHELIAMVSRGAPYMISGRGSSLISLADAPVEFTFLLAVHIFGAVAFTIGPLFLIAMRLLARKRSG
jgi:hypothetical protein